MFWRNTLIWHSKEFRDVWFHNIICRSKKGKLNICLHTSCLHVFKVFPQNFAVSPLLYFWDLFTVVGLQTNSETCSNSACFAFGDLFVFQRFGVCVCLMNTQMQKKNKKRNSFSPTGHMNMALSKAVLPCILKATGRWNRCNMDFCSVSIHSAVSWANNLKCINHPMNISSFSAHEKSTSKTYLQQKVLVLKNGTSFKVIPCVFYSCVTSTFLRSGNEQVTPLPWHCSVFTHIFSITKFITTYPLKGNIHW